MAAAQFRLECSASDRSFVDWRALLRQWLHDRVKTDWSSWPYSKKHIHRGIYMPSLGVESPGHIVFAIDTSASMSEPDLANIAAELRSFRETFPCRLTVIQADAAIQQIQVYEDCDGTEVPKALGIQGRGGTDFRPVFEWLNLQQLEGCTVVIYATDGFGTYPTREPRCPVIWLLTSDSMPPSRIPFGMHARLR